MTDQMTQEYNPYKIHELINNHLNNLGLDWDRAQARLYSEETMNNYSDLYKISSYATNATEGRRFNYSTKIDSIDLDTLDYDTFVSFVLFKDKALDEYLEDKVAELQIDKILRYLKNHNANTIFTSNEIATLVIDNLEKANGNSKARVVSPKNIKTVIQSSIQITIDGFNFGLENHSEEVKHFFKKMLSNIFCNKLVPIIEEILHATQQTNVQNTTTIDNNQLNKLFNDFIVLARGNNTDYLDEINKRFNSEKKSFFTIEKLYFLGRKYFLEKIANDIADDSVNRFFNFIFNKIPGMDYETNELDTILPAMTEDERISFIEYLRYYLETDPNAIHIFIFSNDFKHQIELETTLEPLRKKIQKSITEQIKKIDSNLNLKYLLKNITVEFDTLGNITLDLCGQNILMEHEIDIIDRANLLSFYPESKIEDHNDRPPNFASIVVNAKLHDLVEILNDKGNDLFKYNVRYGISNNKEVDLAIIETLENAPEDFWFKNNGVTLVVLVSSTTISALEYLDLRDPQKIYLYEKSRNGQKLSEISVINGAQTLSSSARFFFNSETKNVNKIQRAIDNARVMLRVIIVEEPQQDEISTKAIDQLAISLNRQKPVNAQDIAYTVQIIESINNLYTAHANKGTPLSTYAFKIIRRGERENSQQNSYHLNFISKILYILFNKKPGQARTSSYNKLLKLNTDSSFKENIFPGQNNAGVSDDSIFENDIFEIYYKPVNFAVSLFNFISNHKDTQNEGPIPLKRNNFNKYSSYLKLTIILTAMKKHFDAQNNDQNDTVQDTQSISYENWNYSDTPEALLSSDRANEDKYLQISDRIFNFLNDEYSEDDNTFESNFFKSDEKLSVAIESDALIDEIKDILFDQTSE